jgi:hypothetical protein
MQLFMPDWDYKFCVCLLTNGVLSNHEYVIGRVHPLMQRPGDPISKKKSWICNDNFFRSKWSLLLVCSSLMVYHVNVLIVFLNLDVDL